METKEKLIQDALQAVANEDWDGVYKSLHEILLHLPSFAWIVNDEKWEEEDLKSACHQIGDAIYEKAGFSAMQSFWYQIDDSMSGMGSKPLERYWDGCGNGAWEA